MVGGVANQDIILDDDVGETVTGIDADVHDVHDTVAESGRGTVFKEIHGLASLVVADHFGIIVVSGVRGVVLQVVDSLHPTSDVDSSVGSQVPVDADATHHNALKHFTAELHLPDDGFSVGEECVIVNKAVPIESPAEANLIGFAEKVTLTESKVAVEAIPGVCEQVVVILEVSGLLPTFIINLLEGAVVASETSVVFFQAGLATHAVDGAGVVESVIADIQFSAFTQVFVFHDDACRIGGNFVIAQQYSVGTFHVDKYIFILENLWNDDFHAVLFLNEGKGAFGRFLVACEVGSLRHAVTVGVVEVGVEVG